MPARPGPELGEPVWIAAVGPAPALRVQCRAEPEPPVFIRTESEDSGHGDEYDTVPYFNHPVYTTVFPGEQDAVSRLPSPLHFPGFDKLQEFSSPGFRTAVSDGGIENIKDQTAGFFCIFGTEFIHNRSMSDTVSGFSTFILTTRARDVRGRCELEFRGNGRDGPCLIRIYPYEPVFFIAADAELPHGLDAERRSLALSTMDGQNVDGLYFPSLGSWRDGRSRLTEDGIRTWEADVRPEDRYLMERFITGAAVVEGPVRMDGFTRVFENPRIQPSEDRPKLGTLSLDIETGQDGRLYGLAVDAAGPAGTFRRAAVLDESAPPEGRRGMMPAPSGAGEGSPGSFELVPTEQDLLNLLTEWVREADPDFIIGWHVIGFDLAFLDRKSRQLGFTLRLGRGDEPMRLVEMEGRLPIVDLQGRLVIDGPPTLRGAFHKFSDWRLDTVAHELLGRGKEIQEHGSDKVAEIERRFCEDKGALAFYNLDDCILVTEIFRHTGVLEQLLTRSLITGLVPDQVHRSVAAFDRFFLPRLHRKGMVAPNQADITAGDHAAGGLVFSEKPGLFDDVAVLDFKSLYPTVIRTFHIDPYSLVKAAGLPLNNPAGIPFSRSEHILPEYLGELMEKRSEARASGDAPLAQAVKILMNSMYGVMGSPGCRFYHSELPTAITGIGQWVLRTTAERLRSWGYQVLYGDTDSVFVKLKTDERQDPDRAGSRLAARVDDYFRETIRRSYGVPSRLELEYEKRYLKLFLPVMRSSGGEGAVKRYAGLLSDGSVEIKGMEFVRSDSTALAREFQMELFRRYFAGEELHDWIRQVVADIRAGRLDGKLVYRRRLTRRAREYKSPPPHVRAVMMLDPDGSRDLREVEYVITPDGPVPLELQPREIDYNHYIEKQIRSVADDVLAPSGDSFDAVMGGKQLDLFP